MADFVWPKCVLTPSDISVAPKAQNTSGGVSISGIEQIIGNGSGRWGVSLIGVRVFNKAQVKTWRAIEAGLGGRNKTILVPLFARSYAPWPIVSGKPVTTYGDIPFDDGALFNDGVGFYQPVIDAEVVSTVAAGTVTALIKINRGSDLEAGSYFSYDERAYLIRQVLDEDRSGLAPIFTVRFSLPAREQIPSGAALNFDDPMLRCRLAADNAMDLTLLKWRFGNAPTVSFIEDV